MPNPFKAVNVTRSLHTTEYRNFIARLRRARELRGVTQADLAKRLGKPQSYVSKYESRERRLDLVEFLNVANSLELNVCKFIEETLAAKSKD